MRTQREAPRDEGFGVNCELMTLETLTIAVKGQIYKHIKVKPY